MSGKPTVAVKDGQMTIILPTSDGLWLVNAAERGTKLPGNAQTNYGREGNVNRLRLVADLKAQAMAQM